MHNSRTYVLFIATSLFLIAFQAAGKDKHGQTPTKEGARGTPDAAVRKLLSDERMEDSDSIKAIFELAEPAVPTLVAALLNRSNTERAVWALVYLGGPEERKLLLNKISVERNKEMKLFMSSFFAGALVE